MGRVELARWLTAFLEASENGEIAERDLIVLDAIRAYLDTDEPEDT